MKWIAILVASLAALALTGCKNAPGADGQYATHDRGNGTIDPSARQIMRSPGY